MTATGAIIARDREIWLVRRSAPRKLSRAGLLSGHSGSALRKMLEEAGIDLRQLRLANAIPLRPIEYSKHCKPRNRTPTIEEIDRYGAAVLTRHPAF
jgi:uracil-DNA glycosylase